MVWVTYHCPYCGAVTGVERDAYLNDKCVTREPLDGWTYASTTDDDVEAADGIEFVCLGDGADPDAVESSESPPDASGGGANDPRPDEDGCGRTFYLSFVRYEDGEEVEHRTPDVDRPRFDFSP
ncbi:hypothetical protein G9C85_04915 [Halorubellus sp. JP-L1]|uniref:hypothetical protein n=1 Tax=Halorubellus sp. JP-L1 TaxID=2715753 RepID=UPI00140A64FD|nr:hypothetical protein [Halorubellus sp. JP-L1]NHN40978.1 hypothetical protein [Halorubellus sp. JP-L1]